MRSTIKHQPFFCEENVWHLARERVVAHRRRHVVFISNEARTVAMGEQRVGVDGATAGAIVWDYHVVLLAEAPWEIWDLDTRLPFPCPAPTYFRRSFPGAAPPELRPRFRVIDADLFGDAFASDRAHMRDEEGAFRSAPPPWPPIGRPGVAPNLQRFIDVRAPFLGEVLDLAGLLARVGAA